MLAQEESRLLGHGSIGCEHILAGIVAEGSGLASKVLHQTDVTLEAVREQIEAAGRVTTPTEPPAPQFTEDAKKVLEHAVRESLRLGHNRIGTEHLLLGLLRTCDPVTTRIFANLGVDPEQLRVDTLELLDVGEA